MSGPLRFDQLEPARQDVIRKNLDTMHAKGAPDADVESYLRDVEHLAPVGQDAPQEGLASRVAHQVVGGLSQAVRHPIDTATGILEAPVRSAITAMSPGVGEARPSAALSKGGNSSGRPIDTSPYDAEHGGVTGKERAVGAAQTIANIALPSIAKGTSSLVQKGVAGLASKAGAGATLSRVLGTSAAGGTAGAVYSPDDPIAGGLAGAVMAPVLSEGGRGLHKGLTGTGSALLDNVFGRPVESGPAIKAGPLELGHIEGHDVRAPQVIARRAAMDAQSGHVAPEGHRSLPPIALDKAGPNVEGLAEGIAQRPGPGRAQILKTVEARRAQMRPALSQTLEENTGVKADARMAPQQEAIDARSAEAKTNYDAARAETKGQAVTSPAFEEIKNTPAGKQALKVAMAKQGNLFHELPEEGAVPSGFSPEQWATAKQHMQERGMLVPDIGGESLPDPETLHLMKQHLRKMTKMGDPNDPVTADAFHVLSVIDRVRDELPESWRKADDAYAERSRIIEMGDRGRNVYRTELNPATPGQKGINKSLDGLRAKAAEASPDEAAALQKGAATATHAKLARAPTSIKSPSRIFPQSDVATEQRRYAFPSPERAADFEQAVSAWDRAQQQAERITGNSRTGLRGAEGSGSSPAAASLLTGSPRAAIRAIIHTIGGAARLGNQQKLEGEIARILTSPDGLNLSPPERATFVHGRVSSLLKRGGLMAAVTGQNQAAQ